MPEGDGNPWRQVVDRWCRHRLAKVVGQGVRPLEGRGGDHDAEPFAPPEAEQDQRVAVLDPEGLAVLFGAPSNHAGAGGKHDRVEFLDARRPGEIEGLGEAAFQHGRHEPHVRGVLHQRVMGDDE